MSPVITNISCYKFAQLADLKALRERLIGLCKGWGLKGTILLSTEGINFFVAGPLAEIDLLVAELRRIPGLADLQPKHSPSGEQPFTRMLVRIKKEIIAFGVEGIDPAQRPSPKLPAATLKQWLDEGRPITLLDTRNDYEVKLGTFRGAQALSIDHFRQFPDAVRALPAELKSQPIVMFCTGGIRCEKAGPFMEREGFTDIYQLDGGILKYFEQVGGDHYDGECFVFDQRVGVDPSLRETDSTQCYSCQTPLDADDQRDARFVAGKSCPYCFKTSEAQLAENLAVRQATIARIATPLPGSVPYENRRPLNVPAAHDGQTLLDFLSAIFPHVEREEWLRRCELGRFTTLEGTTLGSQNRVVAGDRLIQLVPGTTEPDVSTGIRLIHEDEAIIVLVKPAPLPMHPSGRFNRNTLQHLLCAAYAPQRIRFAHRLDANTTGLVVCARTRHFANLLGPQFARGEVEKVYLARVQGHPPRDAFTCEAPIRDEATALGAREIDEAEGQPAHTVFRVRERFLDGTTLLEAEPITGRTNQIRLHLQHLGFPILGDATYLPNGQRGDTQTLAIEAAPLCLHAWRLGFQHPRTQARMSFETALPEWALLPSP